MNTDKARKLLILTIPLPDGMDIYVRVPYPMSAGDHDQMRKTLAMWKRGLVAPVKPATKDDA